MRRFAYIKHEKIVTLQWINCLQVIAMSYGNAQLLIFLLTPSVEIKTFQLNDWYWVCTMNSLNHLDILLILCIYFSTPKGLEDVSTYPLLFAELLAAGWSTDELKKLAGLNFLRVFEEVERVRDEQAGAGVPPYEESSMQPWPGLGYNCTSQDLF